MCSPNLVCLLERLEFAGDGCGSSVLVFLWTAGDLTGSVSHQSGMIKRTEHSWPVISDLGGAPVYLSSGCSWGCAAVCPHCQTTLMPPQAWTLSAWQSVFWWRVMISLLYSWKKTQKVNFKLRTCVVCIDAALHLLTSRIFCRRLRLSMSCGVCPAESLLLSLLLRLVALGLWAFCTLKTTKSAQIGCKRETIIYYLKATCVSFLCLSIE